MTFEQYLTKLNKGKPSFYRMGQWAFNELSAIKPKLANDIVGMAYDGDLDIDPFYDDSNLTKFFEYVAAHWSEIT